MTFKWYLIHAEHLPIAVSAHKTSPHKQGKKRALGSTISHNFLFNSILDGDFRPAAYEKIM